jgi:uncharacterized protein YjbI with pentapeptide repeats
LTREAVQERQAVMIKFSGAKFSGAKFSGAKFSGAKPD